MEGPCGEPVVPSAGVVTDGTLRGVGASTGTEVPDTVRVVRVVRPSRRTGPTRPWRLRCLHVWQEGGVGGSGACKCGRRCRFPDGPTKTKVVTSKDTK